MENSKTHRVCIGLGSNLGDRLASIRAARESLQAYIQIESVSPVYETAPTYVTDQPAFLNAALVGTTALDPIPLLYTLKNIERELGRMPTYQYGPRLIDLDVLFYDDLKMITGELTIPHPRIEERSFVLRPLVKIVPEWVHPVLGKTVRELLSALPGLQSVHEISGSF